MYVWSLCQSSCVVVTWQPHSHTRKRGDCSLGHIQVHVNLAQAILKKQFGRITGLQSTPLLLGCSLYYSVVPSSGALQIVHALQGSHWIVTFTISCANRIPLFDSLYSQIDAPTAHLLTKAFGSYSHSGDGQIITAAGNERLAASLPLLSAPALLMANSQPPPALIRVQGGVTYSSVNSAQCLAPFPVLQYHNIIIDCWLVYKHCMITHTFLSVINENCQKHLLYSSLNTG